MQQCLQLTVSLRCVVPCPLGGSPAPHPQEARTKIRGAPGAGLAMGGLCDGSFGQQWSVFDLEADTAAMVAEMTAPAEFKFELVGMTIDAFDEGTFVAGVADATGEDEKNISVESVRHVGQPPSLASLTPSSRSPRPPRVDACPRTRAARGRPSRSSPRSRCRPSAQPSS